MAAKRSGVDRGQLLPNRREGIKRIYLSFTSRGPWQRASTLLTRMLGCLGDLSSHAHRVFKARLPNHSFNFSGPDIRRWTETRMSLRQHPPPRAQSFLFVTSGLAILDWHRFESNWPNTNHSHENRCAQISRHSLNPCLSRHILQLQVFLSLVR
jgi:hypothetical protein